MLSLERGQGLGQALQTLPVEQKQVLEMAFTLALPHREIAQKLDIPLGTVKSRIRLGIARLRAALLAKPQGRA